MTPLVSNLWPQFMVDPAFAACFGQVIVEHAQMLRQERQVIFTLRSGAPLDKDLCARLLASLQPDYEGFELRIQNLFGYAMLDETALRGLMDEMKRDGVPINGFLDRCTIQIVGQKITIGVCHGTKFLQEMHFEKLLAERIAAHTGVTPQVTLQSTVSEAEQHQLEEKLERKIAPPVVKFEKKNTAPSIKVDGLDLTDKPVTIFHGKMFTPKNLTPLKDLGGEGGKIVLSAHCNKAFYCLEDMQLGYTVRMHTVYGEYAYEVSDIFLFNMDDNHVVLDKTDSEQLLLYTCYPRGLGFRRQRLAVVCKKVSGADFK